MSVFGISMVKNERDVIAGTVHHMADHLDGLIIADNGSYDGTRQILESLASELPLTVIDDPEIGYYQSRKMTDLAHMAAKQGATWIVPFDADELWITNKRHERVADMLMALPDQTNIVEANLYNYISTAIDPPEDDPFLRIEWRKILRGALPKVAFRYDPSCVIHQGNHGVTLEDPGETAHDMLTVQHFPWRSAEQFTRKGVQGAAAYAATDLPEDMGAHWRSYGHLVETYGETILGDVFREHFWVLSPTDAGLIHQPAWYRIR